MTMGFLFLDIIFIQFIKPLPKLCFAVCWTSGKIKCFIYKAISGKPFSFEESIIWDMSDISRLPFLIEADLGLLQHPRWSSL